MKPDVLGETGSHISRRIKIRISLYNSSQIHRDHASSTSHLVFWCKREKNFARNLSSASLIINIILFSCYVNQWENFLFSFLVFFCFLLIIIKYLVTAWDFRRTECFVIIVLWPIGLMLLTLWAANVFLGIRKPLFAPSRETFLLKHFCMENIRMTYLRWKKNLEMW